MFIYGTCKSDSPFGNGVKLVGGPLVRLKPPLHASGGSAYYQVDLSALNIGPGSYFFQFWFRDPAAGGAQFNLSDALEVSFVQ